MPEILLDIRNLSVQFFTYQGIVRALEDITIYIERGEILGLVGETGCGKSVLARSVLRLIADPPGKISGGEIFFKGQDILKLRRRATQTNQGKRNLHDLPGTHELP